MRNAAALRALLAALSLALQPIAGSFQPWASGNFTPEALVSMLPLLGILIVVGLLVIVVALASWVLRVLGWGSLCRSKQGRFYCITRIVVLAAPIIGTLIMIAGAVVVALQLALAPSFGRLLPGGLPEGALSVILIGSVVTASADIFEAVATLDLGQLFNVRLLTIASLVFLASSLLGAASTTAQQLQYVSHAASLAAFALLTAGYHLARGVAAAPPPSLQPSTPKQAGERA